MQSVGGNRFGETLQKAKLERLKTEAWPGSIPNRLGNDDRRGFRRPYQAGGQVDDSAVVVAV
jgi:hypothetical protein